MTVRIEGQRAALGQNLISPPSLLAGPPLWRAFGYLGFRVSRDPCDSGHIQHGLGDRFMPLRVGARLLWTLDLRPV
jgi:hypothetical protein